jgi:hypothetical protein
VANATLMYGAINLLFDPLLQHKPEVIIYFLSKREMIASNGTLKSMILSTEILAAVSP